MFLEILQVLLKFLSAIQLCSFEHCIKSLYKSHFFLQIRQLTGQELMWQSLDYVVILHDLCRYLSFQARHIPFISDRQHA